MFKATEKDCIRFTTQWEHLVPKILKLGDGNVLVPSLYRQNIMRSAREALKDKQCKPVETTVTLYERPCPYED